MSMEITDAAAVLGGLLVGVGLIYELIYQTADKKTARVFTPSNSWLILSGVVHCWIEYTMVFHRGNSLIKGPIDFYGTVDSRYGNFDGNIESGTAAMEAITAVLVGPLCFAVVFAAVHDLPWRAPLQLLVCTMQLYGMLWLAVQPLFSTGGWSQQYTADEALFWGVVVGGNLPWLIATPLLWIQAWGDIVQKMN